MCNTIQAMIARTMVHMRTMAVRSVEEVMSKAEQFFWAVLIIALGILLISLVNNLR